MPSSRHFAHRLALFVLFRTLQVLGAYGFRGYFEHKRHFIDSIPGAIQNLRDLLALDRSTFPYPYLMSVLQRLVELPQFTRIEEPAKNRADGFRTTADDVFKANPLDGPATFSKYDGKGPLVVRVFSFSYKNGMVASFFDGIFQGIGYTVVLVIMCTVRELLGAGTLMGIQIMPASYTPALMLVLPVGGFLCLGTLIAVMQWALAKGEKKTAEKNEKEGN